MPTSDLITASHLARKALIYIRQSSPHQVLTNQESLQMQYALQERAARLGWRAEDVEVIDTDLGLSGRAAEHRAGFKELAARVTLGQVGIILSTEVNRLSRNCSDWYPLLDSCGYKGCLIADGDGVYDPATANGRLLLGLKGTISEAELFTIRARLTAGLLNKARRGDLALRLPVGLVRNELGQVEKDPERAVQHCLGMVFTTFLRVRYSPKVLDFFNRRGLKLPRRDHCGELVWRTPNTNMILAILKNPAYAGAFVYGRSRSLRSGASQPTASQQRLSMEEWRIVVRDKYPAYVAWETYLRIQAMLKDNYAEYDRAQNRGVPRDGKALLQGLVYCGECGHKMPVQYKGGTFYVCNFLKQSYHAKGCQFIHADRVDAAVVKAFFQALAPIEMDVYARAVTALNQSDEQAARAHRQLLERLRYQAALSQRQFLRVDPDNRLVAAELEARWEAALRDLRQAEEAAVRPRTSTEAVCALTPELKAAFTELGRKLPAVWDTPQLSNHQRKALLRCLIEKVVIHRVVRDLVQARIVWKGGATTTLRVPVPVGCIKDLSTAEEMKQQIRELFLGGKSDREIAEQLTAQGHRSPMRSVVIANTVKVLRLQQGLRCKRQPSGLRRVPGHRTLPELAHTLGVAEWWLRESIQRGRIVVGKDPRTKMYLFPDEPETLTKLAALKADRTAKVSFSKEHQHA